ncbi:MAG: hypothetical protein AAGD05_05465 [Bacteroidota bacterium]
MKNIIYASLLFTIGLWGCKENTYLYDVNEILVTDNNIDKDKEKTIEQYLSILYANLFQTAISPNQLVEATEVVQSIGDKQVAYETIIAKFMARPDVVIPSNANMRNNLEQFVIDTYNRFYVRTPTEAEKAFFVHFLETRPHVTPELVYLAFATSNEYYHY